MIILILILFLVGCNDDPDVDCFAGFGMADSMTDGGILVWGETDADLDSLYLDVKNCTQLDAEAPNVYFPDDYEEISQCYNNPSEVGFMVATPGRQNRIVINLQTLPRAVNYEFIKHEYIHHLLNLNGQVDINHEPEHLWQCQY